MNQQRIGRYQVLEDIAAGGQGAVYKAIDPLIDRIVAIKVLKPELTSDGGYLERFFREAALAAQIDHPNVVKIFDMGEDGGRHFIVMEYLPRNLADLIPQDKGLPIDRVLELGGQIAEGLAAAHSLGITHRDVKPQNVLITQDDDAKVTDFGIARAEALSTMTATGMIMGTPHYMSPEQARGTRVDVRSDVYSLGCLVYEMLTGNLPFSGNTPYEVIRQHVEEQPRPLRELRREVPRELTEVVERAMEKDPGVRFQSAGDFAGAIRSVTAGTGRQTRATKTPGPPPRPADAPPSGSGAGASGKPETPAASKIKARSVRKPMAILGLALAILVVAIAIAVLMQANGITPGIAPELLPQQLAAHAPAPTAQAASPSSPEKPVAPIPAEPAAPAPSLPAGAAPTPLPRDAAPAPVPASAGASPSGKIAFESRRNGNYEIYVMNADGSNQVNLTNNPAFDTYPSWSPDGSNIAFLSNRHLSNIYAMNASGSNQVNLTNNPDIDSYPSWSPDGNKIAFESRRDGNHEIYVMNADGSNQVRLTNNRADDREPSWSPDGSKIVFMSQRDVITEIYVMNADGSSQVNLTNSLAPDSHPSWSPDNRKIAFVSNSEIYVMNTDGSNQVNLTNNPSIDNSPSWSPDGSKIAFESQRDGNFEIYVMNADGSNQVRLTNNRADDRRPSWGPVTSTVDSVTTSAAPLPTPTPAVPTSTLSAFLPAPATFAPTASPTPTPVAPTPTLINPVPTSTLAPISNTWNTFTLGSHKDDVVRIQGTPTNVVIYEILGQETWRYGSSSVEFDLSTNLVTAWNDIDDVLKVFISPGPNVTVFDTFTFGSHKDDVVRIQGTPTNVVIYEILGQETWRYGSSSVEFDLSTNLVTAWNDIDNVLKVSVQ